MNKELEEAAEKHSNQWIDGRDHYYGFISGAKYMQEKMFNEDDIRKAIIFGLDGMYGLQWGKQGQTDKQMDKYLKQLKKK